MSLNNTKAVKKFGEYLEVGLEDLFRYGVEPNVTWYVAITMEKYVLSAGFLQVMRVREL